MNKFFTSLAMVLLAITTINAQVAFFYHDQKLEDNATITITKAITANHPVTNTEGVELLTEEGVLQLRNITNEIIPSVWGRLNLDVPSGVIASMCSTSCYPPESLIYEDESPAILKPMGTTEDLGGGYIVQSDRLQNQYHLYLPKSMENDPYATTLKMNYYTQVNGAPGTEIAKLNMLFDYLPANLNGMEQIGLQEVKLIQMDGLCTLQYASSGKNLKLEIFNLLGSKEVSMPLPAGSSSVNIPTRLQKGVHIFRITSNGKPAFVQKFIIK